MLNPLLGLVSNTYLPIVNDVPGVREVAFEANKFHQVSIIKHFLILVDFFTFGNVLPANERDEARSRSAYRLVIDKGQAIKKLC